MTILTQCFHSRGQIVMPFRSPSSPHPGIAPIIRPPYPFITIIPQHWPRNPAFQSATIKLPRRSNKFPHISTPHCLPHVNQWLTKIYGNKKETNRYPFYLAPRRLDVHLLLRERERRHFRGAVEVLNFKSRSSAVRVVCEACGARSFTSGFPSDFEAGWHFVIVRARQNLPKWIAVLRMTPLRPDLPPTEFTIAQPYLWNPFGLKFGVFYVPRIQNRLEVEIYSLQSPPRQAHISFIPVSRLVAAITVCLQNLPGCIAAFKASTGAPLRRLRSAVAATAINGQHLPKSYANWISWFDAWHEERVGELLESPHRAHWPIMSALVLGSEKSGGPARAATEASLREQILPSCEVISHQEGEVLPRVDGILGEYVAVLQAGEVIPRHALLLLADELVRLDFPEILLADEDMLDEGGGRSRPLFKPQPNLTLMCSGLLSRGIWVIRRESLAGALEPPFAECVRLKAWFRVYEAGRAAATHRIPYVLTHRRPDTENAPPIQLAAVVETFLGRAGIEATISPRFPLRLQWQPGALKGARVSLIVPSRLRGETQISCLTQILQKTSHRNFEMLVLITQTTPLDVRQQAAIRLLSEHENFRHELILSDNFNYSTANNIGAAKTTGDFLCLLNDDVAPMHDDWLDRMLGFFTDPNCGIVGAKLFYPNFTTQHGGVIMGLAGLVEHANRFLPRGNPGYAWRAELDQELSAVTGACLLVRRSVFEAVKGLDEEFPTAFNDVDFCLRVREAGSAIVFAASVEMIHHETLTFGQHYSPEMTEQETSDIIRLRTRWSEVCKTDPFHNPNLSLIGRSEWNLAYPPRKPHEQTV